MLLSLWFLPKQTPLQSAYRSFPLQTSQESAVPKVPTVKAGHETNPPLIPQNELALYFSVKLVKFSARFLYRIISDKLTYELVGELPELQNTTVESVALLVEKVLLTILSDAVDELK